MRRARAFVFLAVGLLLGLVVLAQLVFFLTSGDLARDALTGVFAAGTVACFRAALADRRRVRRADLEDRPRRAVRSIAVAACCAAGSLLGLLAADEVRNLIAFHNRPWVRSAPWSVHALLFAFPFLFAVAAVACFRRAASISHG